MRPFVTSPGHGWRASRAPPVRLAAWEARRPAKPARAISDQRTNPTNSEPLEGDK